MKHIYISKNLLEELVRNTKIKNTVKLFIERGYEIHRCGGEICQHINPRQIDLVSHSTQWNKLEALILVALKDTDKQEQVKEYLTQLKKLLVVKNAD